MKRWIIFFLIMCSPALAQVKWEKFMAFSGTAVAAYTGPIDVNGAAFAFWSTRCGSTSYTGNVMDVWDSATGSTTETLVTCSSGGTLNETINPLATTCASGCSVKTLYDQVGTNCGGVCDATQATNASRPSLTTSCLNGKSCLVFDGAASCLGTASLTNTAQPFSISMVFNSTSATTAYNWVGPSAASFIRHSLVAGSIDYYGNGAAAFAATASDSNPHAAQLLANGLSSTWYIDGSSTTPGGTSPGTLGTFAETKTFGAYASGAACGTPSSFWSGKLFEFGIWSSDVSANNATMNSNQHTYWNF